MTMPNTLSYTEQLSLLKFSGTDASSFLQGQLTNDINALESNWQYSGYCNPKGRLLALFILWKSHDDIYALLPASLVEATCKRLRMYVMRSKVTIENIENVHLSNSLTSINQRFTCQHSADCFTLGFGDRDLIVNLNSSEINNPVDREWSSLNIKDGLPEITEKTAELFVPQMINLDLIDGVSFKKGCYTGQEIVARMHYLGKLKQRMFVCTLDILSGNNEQTDNICGHKVLHADKSAGHIVSHEGNLALAVLRTEYAELKNNHEFKVENIGGKEIGLRINDTQPYSLELKGPTKT